jgi:surface protein
LDLSNFETQNVTDMSRMFSLCESLANLDLGDHFNTDKVIDMDSMFASCYKLESLNLTTFTFNSNVAIEGIFNSVGMDAVNKPIPIYVTSDGKDFIETSGNSEIDSQYAKLVIPNNRGLGFDGPDGDLNGDEEWF